MVNSWLQAKAQRSNSLIWRHFYIHPRLLGSFYFFLSTFISLSYAIFCLVLFALITVANGIFFRLLNMYVYKHLLPSLIELSENFYPPILLDLIQYTSSTNFLSVQIYVSSILSKPEKKKK